MADDKPQQESRDERNPILRDFALFGLIVGDVLGYTGAGIGIGWWLWKKQGAPTWVFFLFAGVGFVCGMYRIYMIDKRGK